MDAGTLLGRYSASLSGLFKLWGGLKDAIGFKNIDRLGNLARGRPASFNCYLNNGRE
jgi:hypothetical protein